MSRLHFLGFFVFCLSSAVAVTVNSKCEPTCEGVTESGTLVMDPSNCLGYYECIEINGEYLLSDSLECPVGDYFNINLVPPQCASIATAHDGYCEGYCNPCKVQCSETGTLRPNPLNCTQYYLCLANDASQVLICEPDNPYFDYDAEICQGDESLCYPYCDEDKIYCVETGFIADPTDCQKYYYCEPPNVVPFTCDDDQYFDSTVGVCVDGSCFTTTTSTTTTSTSTTSTTTPSTIITEESYSTETSTSVNNIF